LIFSKDNISKQTPKITSKWKGIVSSLSLSSMLLNTSLKTFWCIPSNSLVKLLFFIFLKHFDVFFSKTIILIYFLVKQLFKIHHLNLSLMAGLQVIRCEPDLLANNHFNQRIAIQIICALKNNWFQIKDFHQNIIIISPTLTHNFLKSTHQKRVQ